MEITQFYNALKTGSLHNTWDSTLRFLICFQCYWPKHTWKPLHKTQSDALHFRLSDQLANSLGISYVSSLVRDCLQGGRITLAPGLPSSHLILFLTHRGYKAARVILGSVSSRECLDAPAIFATFTAGRTSLVIV